MRTHFVQGIQDPRANINSILTRHFLFAQIFGGRFSDTEASELRHAARLNTERVAGRTVSEDDKAVFQGRWRSALSACSGGTISVLECGCGSATDYRFWDAYGIARLLIYKGFDLSTTMRQRAGMFPDVYFERGNILNIRENDESFDYVVAFDLFEHLSLNVSDIPQRVSKRVPERHYQ